MPTKRGNADQERQQAKIFLDAYSQFYTYLRPPTYPLVKKRYSRPEKISQEDRLSEIFSPRFLISAILG